VKTDGTSKINQEIHYDIFRFKADYQVKYIC